MTTELIITRGPSKLELMLALFDKDARGPRFIDFAIEGELWCRYPGENIPDITAMQVAKAAVKKIRERPHSTLPSQTIGACVTSVTALFGDKEEWSVTGTVQGRVMWVRAHEEDIPFRARISTKTRRGRIEFD